MYEKFNKLNFENYPFLVLRHANQILHNKAPLEQTLPEQSPPQGKIFSFTIHQFTLS